MTLFESFPWHALITVPVFFLIIKLGWDELVKIHKNLQNPPQEIDEE